MIKDLMKIATFLDKSGRVKDANFIDYIAEKYAGGDLEEFFNNKMQKDFLVNEFGRRIQKKKGPRIVARASQEEQDTEELLKSLCESFKG